MPVFVIAITMIPNSNSMLFSVLLFLSPSKFIVVTFLAIPTT